MKYNEPKESEKIKQEALMGVDFEVTQEEEDAIDDLVSSDGFKKFENLIRDQLVKSALSVMNLSGSNEEILQRLYYLKGRYGAFVFIKEAIKKKNNAAKQNRQKSKE